jgi:hypothetical protein
VQKRGMSNLPTETRNYVQKIYGGDPITIRDTMSGATRTAPGRPVVRLNPMEEESAGRRSNYTARRRDTVEPSTGNDMGWLEGFLSTRGGLLDRIGGAMAASDGRHPAQLAREQLELERRKKESDDFSSRYFDTLKASADPDIAYRYAMGDESALLQIDPDKARMMSRGDYGYQSLGMFQDESGAIQGVSFNRDTNNYTTTPVGGGLTRLQDTGVGKANDLDAAAVDDLGKQSADSGRQLARINQMRGLVASNPEMFGPDAQTRLARWLAINSGVKVANFSAEDVQVAEAVAAQMNLDSAKQLTGQGVITDFERGLIAATAPSLDTDPNAANRILDIMADSAARPQRLYAAWLKATKEEKAGGLRAFEAKFLEDENERALDRYVADLPPGTPFLGTDGKQYIKQ